MGNPDGVKILLIAPAPCFTGGYSLETPSELEEHKEKNKKINRKGRKTLNILISGTKHLPRIRF